MADVPQTLSLITLAQEYRGDVVRQINRRTVLLRLLRIEPGSGKNVAWTPEADGQNAENYSEGADASDFGSDAQAPATLQWGLYRANFHVTALAMDAAVGASTPVGNRQLWARNMVNASAKLADTVEAALHVGPGTGTTIAGLGEAIGSAGNQYAGIDRSSAAYWRPFVTDPGTPTDITLAQIRSDLGSIYDSCGMNPEIALVGTKVFNKVGGLFDAGRDYVSVVNTARGPVRLNGGVGINNDPSGLDAASALAGAKGIDVEGTVFIRSRNVPDGYIHYINTDHLWIEYLPPAEVPQSVYQYVNADDGFGQLMLGMVYEKLAKTGAAEKAMVRTSLQLKCTRPNSCGTRKNVAV